MGQSAGRVILYGVFIITMVGILWLTTSRTDEQQYIEFNVQGRLLDEHGGLADAEVVLLLRHNLIEDQQYFFIRQKMERMIPEKGGLGLADAQGYFKARATAWYGRQSSILPNIFRDDRHPFKRVWLLMRPVGSRQAEVYELDASLWDANGQSSGKLPIQLGDLFFASTAQMSLPHVLVFPVDDQNMEEGLEFDCNLSLRQQNQVSENVAWLKAQQPLPQTVQFKVSLMAPGVDEYNYGLAERCGQQVKGGIVALQEPPFAVQLVTRVAKPNRAGSLVTVEFIPVEE